ncbi:MAG: elongation factor G [Nitrospinae bacterium]|nr:elongation factor G [Nitrospinota bacterium]
MKEYKTENIRNIGIVAHGGAGKTSLAEALLFDSKAIDKLGKTLDGSTVMDYDPDEIEKKITLSSAVAFCEWKNHKINIIDTPGYQNFIADTQGCMRVMDGVVVIVSAISGVKLETEKVWGWADDLDIPKIVFVNKMDQERASYVRAFDDIKKMFKQRPVKLTLPIGEEASFMGVVDLLSMKALKFSANSNGEYRIEDIPEDLKKKSEEHRVELMEAVAESDDTLIEKYLNEGSLSDEELRKGLRKAVLNGAVVPVICGSALKNISVQPLLDAAVEFFPSPKDKPVVKGKRPGNNEEITRETSDIAPFSALAFKTVVDPYAGKLTLFRVYSGTLNSDSTVLNPNRDVKEKVGHIFLITGKKQTAVAKVSAGDIAGVAKLKATMTGDTLCSDKDPVILDPIKFPNPVISLAIEPKTKADDEKVSLALPRMSEEDPTLKISRDTQTKELILSGMGQVHLEVIVGRLKRKFGVEVEMKTPRVPYKETIKGMAKVQGKYKRQSGGRGQYGDCWIELEHLPRGKGFLFVDKIVGGTIPKNYIPAVEKGVVEAMEDGIVAGYPVTDVKVTIYDGSYHDVDSSEMAFKIAGSMAFKKGMQEAKPILLEPIMNIEVIVPDENMGDVIGDLNSRRGKVTGVVPQSRSQAIKANVPMAEVLRYAMDLRSMTGGRGVFTMDFSNYEEVPGHLSEKIVNEAKARKEETKHHH